MKCSEVNKLIDAYGDGRLSKAKASEVARHLEACAACGQVVQRLVEITAVARTATVPADLKATVRQTLASSPRHSKDKKKVNRTIRGVSLATVGLATSLALAFVALKPIPSIAAVMKKVVRASQNVHTLKEKTYTAATDKRPATTTDLYMNDTEIFFSAGEGKFGVWTHKWPLSEHVMGPQVVDLMKRDTFDSGGWLDNGIKNGQHQLVMKWTDTESDRTSGQFRRVIDIDPNTNLISHSTIEELNKQDWETRYEFWYTYNVEIPKGEIVFRDGVVLGKIPPAHKGSKS